MSGRLAGKTALITAAGQGMGHACAVQMAAEGATVYATDVNPQLLEQFGGMRGVIARPLDDSVVATLEDGAYPMRRARGYAPMPVATRAPGPVVLAVGGHQKVALGCSCE